MARIRELRDRARAFSRRKIGFDILRSTSIYSFRRQLVLQSTGVKLLFDVGANQGQYATQVWREGYKGEIVSFEPANDPFYVLDQKTKLRPRWSAINAAVGDAVGVAELEIFDNSYFNSLDKISPDLEEV